jgi:hypothetical protein
LAVCLQELMSANPSKRPSVSDKVSAMKAGAGYFKNVLIDTLLFLEEIQIKDDQVSLPTAWPDRAKFCHLGKQCPKTYPKY